MEALSAAGMLDAVKAAALQRSAAVIHSHSPEESIVLPCNPPHLALSRPALIDTLLQRVALCPHVTLSRGKSVANVGYDAGDGAVRVGLDDGTTICATHLVAADGKWSVVRAAFFEDWLVQALPSRIMRYLLWPYRGHAYYCYTDCD
jgi:2-polyprenyl-6-methoxyphenol hydroxylase-like FAD-dependent oxidoreductase